MHDENDLKKVFMMNVPELITTNRRQYQVYLVLSLVVLGFVSILHGIDRTVFQRFLGGINPLLAFLVAIVLGLFFLSYFLFEGWFAVYERGNGRGLAYAAGIAAVLGLIMIFVDTKIVFPHTINILFPKSLLFYPAIGLFVEIVFHMLPVGLLLLLLSTVFRDADRTRIIWVAIVIVPFLDPVYQGIHMASSGLFPLWAVLYVGFHIFIINFCQLSLFRRYDFITMYVFRLVYYLFWHIVWGYLRLEMLF